MKCIKCIKVAKGYELDEIRRITDIDADEKVKGGYWKFVPKSEWKSFKGKSKTEVITEEVETQVEEIKTKTKKEKNK